MDKTPGRAVSLQALGLSAEATMEEIRLAYRDLVQVWHPDRFQESRLRKLAERKLQEINVAYDALCNAPLQSEAASPVWSANPEVPLKSAMKSGYWRSPLARRSAPAALAGLLGTLVLMAVSAWVILVIWRNLPSVAIPTVPGVPAPLPPASLSPDGSLRAAFDDLFPRARISAEALTERPPASEMRREAATRRASSTESTTRPATGELIQPRNISGEGRLLITNQTADDAYLRMITRQREIVRLLYVRSGDSAVLDHIPVGVYTVETDLGRDWMPHRSAFKTNSREMVPLGPLQFVQIVGSDSLRSDTYRITLESPR